MGFMDHFVFVFCLLGWVFLGALPSWWVGPFWALCVYFALVLQSSSSGFGAVFSAG